MTFHLASASTLGVAHPAESHSDLRDQSTPAPVEGRYRRTAVRPKRAPSPLEVVLDRQHPNGKNRNVGSTAWNSVVPPRMEAGHRVRCPGQPRRGSDVTARSPRLGRASPTRRSELI